MKKILSLVLFGLLMSVSIVNAQEVRATKDEAQTMTERAAQWLREKGPEATFAAINDKANKEFHDRELYVFVYNKEGVNVAHGQKPELIGKNLLNWKDSAGNLMIQAIVGIEKSGWVDFIWNNPVTNKAEQKSAYIVHEGDYWLGVGIYKPE